MKGLKIAGIVLLILQVFSLIGSIASGAPLYNGSIANLIGRFLFGIVGALLLLIYVQKSK